MSYVSEPTDPSRIQWSRIDYPGLEPELEDPSIGQLVNKAVADTTKLFRLELDLFKAEMTIEAKKAGKAAGFLGGAGYAANYLVLFLSLALMFLLDVFMPLVLAAFIVALLWGIVAAVLGLKGKKELDNLDPVPHQTVESIQDLKR